MSNLLTAAAARHSRPRICCLHLENLPLLPGLDFSAEDQILDELTAKVGLDRGTAEKAAQSLKDNSHRLPELLGSDAAGA